MNSSVKEMSLLSFQRERKREQQHWTWLASSLFWIFCIDDFSSLFRFQGIDIVELGEVGGVWFFILSPRLSFSCSLSFLSVDSSFFLKIVFFVLIMVSWNPIGYYQHFLSRLPSVGPKKWSNTQFVFKGLRASPTQNNIFQKYIIRATRLLKEFDVFCARNIISYAL